MFENEAMNEIFEKIKGETKQNLISVFGKPYCNLFSFSVYKNTDMYMVLLFEDTRKENTTCPCLKSAVFFDESRKCIWSGGINLIPEYFSAKAEEFKKVSALIAEFGEPHGIIGESFSALQYLSEDGNFIFVKYNDDDILDISYRNLF
ncbi:MAG: hypothetical protein IKJ88_07735 [Clostridia bacterium]|nr:hypothetical protein [Clostridia bacterium]